MQYLCNDLTVTCQDLIFKEDENLMHMFEKNQRTFFMYSASNIRETTYWILL
jgi:hypothetical protein